MNEAEWLASQQPNGPINERLRARTEFLARAARASTEESPEGWLLVVHGDAIVAIAGDDNTLLLRMNNHPAALRPAPTNIHATANAPAVPPPDGFEAINPWPQDFTFLRADNLLRDAIQRAVAATITRS